MEKEPINLGVVDVKLHVALRKTQRLPTMESLNSVLKINQDFKKKGRSPQRYSLWTSPGLQQTSPSPRRTSPQWSSLKQLSHAQTGSPGPTVHSPNLKLTPFFFLIF